MKSVFLKEWRQAHLLPWGALLLSAGMVALYGLWVTLYCQTTQDAADAGDTCFFVLLVMLAVMALVATAGLIASETGSGSLSYLLALPISRSRLWLGKALAGLALAGACAVSLFAPAAIAIPGVREGMLNAAPYLPDLVVAVLCFWALTMFCSTLFARPLAVLLAVPAVTLLLGLGLGLASSVLRFGVLRYDGELSDITFCLLLAIPIFLFASWAAFQKGELFLSRRHWRVGLTLLGLGLGLMVISLLGIGRWQRHYVRSWVSNIEWTYLPAAGSTAVLLVQGNPAPVTRTPGRGWCLSGKGQGNRRSQHTVLVNLATGRETVWSEDADIDRMGMVSNPTISLSPDGRRVVTADVLGPAYANARFRLWDVPSHRCLTSRVFPREKLPRFLGQGLRDGSSVTWSPTSTWLAWGDWADSTRSVQNGQERTISASLITMRNDGSNRRELSLWKDTYPVDAKGQRIGHRQILPGSIAVWSWAPREDALYLLSDDGQLSRYNPADGSRTLLWRCATVLPEGRKVWTSNLSITPEGRHLAVRSTTVLDPGTTAPAKPRGALSRTSVLALEGDRARPVVEFTEAGSLHPELLWSGDGRTLFLDGTRFWHEGMPRPAPIALPSRIRPAAVQAELGQVALAGQAVPFGSGLLIVLGDASYVINERGQTQGSPQPNSSLLVGSDARGWPIFYCPTLPLYALDPQTGARHTIYP